MGNLHGPSRAIRIVDKNVWETKERYRNSVTVSLLGKIERFGKVVVVDMSYLNFLKAYELVFISTLQNYLILLAIMVDILIQNFIPRTV